VSERTPAGEIPVDVRKLAVAWVRREIGAERQIVGARGLPFDGGVVYHFRTERGADGAPVVRLEVIVNADGSVQGPRRVGSHERRREARAVRCIEGQPVAPRTRYMDTEYKRRGWR